jgi:DNA-binding transcriptional LysR family regulator
MEAGVDLRHLITFRAVVERGSFLAAARALRYAQSTVTLHVQELEAEVGLPLFARAGRRAELTEAGRVLHDEARQVLDRVEGLRQTMAELAGGSGGEVRLGSIEPTASLRLPPLLARLAAERPKLRLRLEVGGTRALCALVASGDLDAAVASPPPARLGLAFEPLFTEALALLLPERHPLARRPRLGAGDLSGHRLLLTDPHCAYREAFEPRLAARGASPETGVEIGSLLAVCRAVGHGLGVAVVPAAMATPPPPGTRLRRLPELEPGLPVGFVRRADAGRPGPATRACLAAIRAHLREATAV